MLEKTIRGISAVLRWGLMLLSLVIFLIGCYILLDLGYLYRHAAAGGTASGVHEPNGGETAEELSDETVAWLTLDGTGIDYPILQAENNFKYLNTDPYGHYSPSGSVFLDCGNAADFSDPYSIVYGHHMSGGFMFGALDRYADETFFDAHRTGTLTVDGLAHGIGVFAYAVVDVGDEAFFSLRDGEQIGASIAASARIYREPTGGNVIALSTCRENDTSERTLVFVELLD